MIDPDEAYDYLIDEVTKAGAFFFAEHDRLEAFRWYVSAADRVMEENSDDLKRYFAEAFRGAPVAELDDLADAFEEGGEVFFRSSTYQLTLSQMIMARLVDNYLSYLKDLLNEVAREKPQVFKSSEDEFDSEFILERDSIEEVARDIADYKTKRLFYKGLDDISDFFASELGVDLFENEEAEAQALLYKDLRNLIVHNRGRVSGQFVDEHPQSDWQEGEVLVFEFQRLSEYNLFFQKLVVDLDPVVANKFGLPQYGRAEVRELAQNDELDL